MWPFKRKEPETETRSSGTGYTTQVMQARADYIGGVDGVAELTGTVQGCVSLWEGGLSLSDVDGTDMLTPAMLALAGRSLALRGEAVFVIREDGLLPCSDWDLTTRYSKPTAYRVGIADTGGGKTETVLAGEVLHLRIGSDVSMPYVGQSPLRRARLTAGLLQIVETALSEVYANAPLGSSVIPFPEAPDQDMSDLARGFRGFRGKMLVRESVNVTAAGGPAPQTDLKPSDVSPDLSRAMTKETLAASRSSIEMVFGVLPGLSNISTTGPMVREAQRHLAQWGLMPIAAMIGQEASEKLGQPVTLDVMRPMQAFDAGGRARALGAIVQTMALAKEAGVDPSEALKLVDWKE
ncbi:Phage portal protein [Roseovarius tolerans]|uniref:Phage portal protein n=1 Tax=Roseovarius tolerans TaxID=74031 RepID=A0A1H7UYR7_9RHOB|nr:phage portal protein [Roseovarius tolerans]SEM02132.1 Phage portal protein [Roseovarius tolerans]